MKRKGDSLQLVIEKQQGSYPGALASRDWVVRFNLPQHCMPITIEVNGKKLELGTSNGTILITQPELREETMPLSGAGSKPRPSAGPILELTIHQKDVRQLVLVSCQLK